MVVLHGINPKTREPLRLPPFKLPPTHQQLAIQPSAVESRHFAATYTLFRICSMKNIHMMLPPMYKDLWKNEFDQLKKEDAKQNRSWMYDPDPFATWVERQEAQAVAAKQREEREKQKSKEAQHPLISIGSTTTNCKISVLSQFKPPDLSDRGFFKLRLGHNQLSRKLFS